jgi:hypothetical protein
MQLESCWVSKPKQSNQIFLQWQIYLDFKIFLSWLHHTPYFKINFISAVLHTETPGSLFVSLRTPLIGVLWVSPRTISLTVSQRVLTYYQCTDLPSLDCLTELAEGIVQHLHRFAAPIMLVTGWYHHDDHDLLQIHFCWQHTQKPELNMSRQSKSISPKYPFTGRAWFSSTEPMPFDRKISFLSLSYWWELERLSFKF